MSDETPVRKSPSEGYGGRPEAMKRTVEGLAERFLAMGIGGEEKSHTGLEHSPGRQSKPKKGKKNGNLDPFYRLTNGDLSDEIALAADAAEGGSPSTRDSRDTSLRKESPIESTRGKRKKSGANTNLGQPAVW